MKRSCRASEGENSGHKHEARNKGRVLMLASVASMIDQFNMANIRLMQEMGYEVHVACNFRKGNTCDAHRIAALQTQLRGMQVFLHQWDCPRSIYAVLACVKAYIQLLRLMDSCRFLWMHCQSPTGAALARLAAHRRQIRVVYTAHGFHFYKGAPFLNWLLYYPPEKLLAHWTDVLVTVNREDYGLAKRRMKAAKVCYIPGVGIDTGRFLERAHTDRSAFCRKYRLPEDAFVLLSVGELSKRKNHQAVLRALAALADPKIYYLICGQGKRKQKLLKQAEALGLRERVRLIGFQEKVEQLYQHADLFVFPSLQEGLPVALMEAMAAGLACVVSDIRGNRELVDDAGGIRFAWRGMQKHPTLAQALAMLSGDRARRQALGRYNQQKIKRYDLDIVEGRMRRIYAHVCKRCKPQNPEALMRENSGKT